MYIRGRKIVFIKIIIVSGAEYVSRVRVSGEHEQADFARRSFFLKKREHRPMFCSNFAPVLRKTRA